MKFKYSLIVIVSITFTMNNIFAADIPADNSGYLNQKIENQVAFEHPQFYYEQTILPKETTINVEKIQAIIAASQSIAASQGTYSNISNSLITELLPKGGLKSSWGGDMIVKGASRDTVLITFNPKIPSNICKRLMEIYTRTSYKNISFDNECTTIKVIFKN